MGMVIGFSPTIGLQMVLCLIISLTANYFRKNTFNTVIALIGSLVVNPFTMVPTYTLYYFTGCQILTCDASVSFQDSGQIQQILMLGGEGALVILIGSIPFMVIGLPVGWWLGRLVERFFERRIERRRDRLVAMAKRRRDTPSASAPAGERLFRTVSRRLVSWLAFPKTRARSRNRNRRSSHPPAPRARS